MSDDAEIKIRYTAIDGRQSTAYVREHPPHTGINKHTDEDVEVVWDAAADAYVEVQPADVGKPVGG